MTRLLGIAWFVVLVALLLVVGQSLGFYDLPTPALRDLRIPLPALLQRGAASQPSPGLGPAPSPGPTASPSGRAIASPGPTTTVVVDNDVCTSTSPSFVHGAADLKEVLGEDMGTPIECEHVIDAAGNTEQQTTTGLVYYRAGANVTVFTTGFDHWALTPGGIRHWTGDALEPPPGAEPG